MLGSLTPILQSVITSHDSLFLGITVGTDDEMTPRVQLGSVPFAVQALTVPDGSVTSAKLNLASLGIGTTNPGRQLDIVGSSGSTEIVIRDNSQPTDLRTWRFMNNTQRLSIDAVNDVLTGGTNVMNFVRNGNVGIGTMSPDSLLRVQGNAVTARFVSPAFDATATIQVRSQGTNPNARSRLELKNIDNADADTGAVRQDFFIDANSANVNSLTGGSNNNVQLYTTTATGIQFGTNSTARMTIDSSGNVTINGNFQVSGGTKSAVIHTAHHGQRKLYAAESPEVRFFDEGLARLKDGIARVTLDPVFLETIEGDYLVHVTPYGNASLYVAEIGKDYFVVKARDGDPNVAFAWRLSAHRKGYGGVRLEQVEEP
jgi:hypothetical protein